MPLLLPLAGVTVHQVVALEAAVHATLDVTPTEAVPVAAPALPVAVLRFKEDAVVPEVQKDLVSEAANCPPVIKVFVPCLIVYDPLP